MTIPPWKPQRLSFDLDRRVDQLFAELIHEPWGCHSESKPWQPAVDVYETESAYMLEADLPGVLPETIELRISGNLLLIHGRRETVQINQTARSVCIERAQGEFSRQFKLEHPVDATRLETHFENGIYRARLPKLALPPP